MLALQQQQRCSVRQSPLAYPQRPRRSEQGSASSLCTLMSCSKLFSLHALGWHTASFYTARFEHAAGQWCTAAHLAICALSLWRLCVLLRPVLIVTVLVRLVPCRQLQMP